MFHIKPRLVTEPFGHSTQCDHVLWSVCEIQLFIEHFLINPKDFELISTHLPHKPMPQLVQFYYDFKKLFGLKKYVADLTWIDAANSSILIRGTSAYPLRET